MALEEIIASNPDTIIKTLVAEIGQIGLWIQAIGLVIILWLVFQIIFLIGSWLRRKKLYLIEERLENIEKKLDVILKRK